MCTMRVHGHNVRIHLYAMYKNIFKITPQGLCVHCCMGRDLRFSTQHVTRLRSVQENDLHDTGAYASGVRVRATLIGCRVLHQKISRSVASYIQCCQTVRFFGQRPILRFLSENQSEKESVRKLTEIDNKMHFWRFQCFQACSNSASGPPSTQN